MYRGSNNSAMDLPLRPERIYWQGVVLLWLALLVAALPQSALTQSAPHEYQVKAAFLFHFAQLIDWPADVSNSGDSSLKICIFNDESHRQELQSTMDGKLVATRVLRVRLISEPPEIQGCNILFLSRDEARRQTAILNRLRGLPILTVGETQNFLTDGGMISFHLEEDRIRFDINLGGAESSHLKISSRLLLLASTVTQSVAPNQGR